MEIKFENKTLLDRFVEFFYSVKIIFDGLKSIEKGNDYQIIPIYGQLRALLAEKTAKNKPLLIDLAKELKYDIKVYYTKHEAANDNRLIMSFYFPKISFQKEKETDIESSIFDYLDMEVVKIDKYRFKIRDFIELYSNKLGGSHYDTKLREDYHYLKNINVHIGADPIVKYYAIEIAKAIYDVSFKFLTHHLETSIYLTLFVPKQTIQYKSWILDLSLPNTNLQCSLTIDKDNLFVFKLTDLQNNSFKVSFNKSSIFNNLGTLVLNAFLTEDFETCISIYWNNELIVEEVFDKTILIVNEFNSITRIYNNSIDLDKNGIKLGIFSFMVANGFTIKMLKENIADLDNSITDNKMLWLEKDQYVAKIIGEKEAKINHTLKFIKTNELQNYCG